MSIIYNWFNHNICPVYCWHIAGEKKSISYNIYMASKSFLKYIYIYMCVCVCVCARVWGGGYVSPRYLISFRSNSQFTYFFIGMKFPIMRKPPWVNLTAWGKVLKTHSLFSSPMCMLPKKTQAVSSLNLLSLSLSLFLTFLSCVPPKNASPFPSNHQPLFIDFP